MLRFSIISQGYLVRPMQDGLAANGCQVRLQQDPAGWDFRDSDYLLLHGPAKPIGRLVRRLKSLPDAPPLIVWYSEQVPNPQLPAWLARMLCKLRYATESWYDQRWLVRQAGQGSSSPAAPGFDRWRRVGELLALHTSGRLRLVCTFSQTHTNFLQELGLPAVTLPFGYHPDFGEDLQMPRDIEVLFLGSTRDARRRRLFPAIQDQFDKRGIQLQIVDGSPARGAAFGEERTRLLNRTRIFMNLMKQPWDDPSFRLLLAAANGAMLLSEPVMDTSLGRFSAGVHFAACELNQLAETAAHYLQEEPARLEITAQAAEDIVQGNRMESMAARLLERLEAKDRVPG